MVTVRLYHYTSRLHLPFILADGYLKVTDNMTRMDRPVLQPGVVWLLDEDESGANADNGLSDMKHEIRFTLEIPRSRVHPWMQWNVQKSRMNNEWREAMVSAGGGYIRAKHWWVTTSRVPKTDWVEIRNMRTGEDLTR